MKVLVVSSPIYKCFCIVYLSVLIIVVAKGTDESGSNLRRLSKRNDVDLQFCVDNFDIQEDTIIRTQDSKDMGAKYINETDLSSREECLKLCCETTSCDVFVFEEKNPGSCYLFNCGPSDDFKCKFTQHMHYTSAILAVSRHAVELESERQHSKHEQELTRLRASPNEMLPSTPSSPALSSTPPPKEVNPPVLPQNTTLMKTGVENAAGTTDGAAFRGGESPDAAGPPSSRREKCSRYQFECRSTGECIAIYNACDGIPQCTDGSDEGSELDCPSAASSSPQVRSHGQDEGGHIHNHPHPQPKVAVVTTAGTNLVTLPPSPQLSSQALPNHIPPAIEAYSPARGSHVPQAAPAPMHQIPAQPQQFQPNWAEQQRQQLQLQAQYHSMDNGYNTEGGDTRPPQFSSSHQQQQQSHIGYPGVNFPMAAASGLRERPPGPQSNNQWPQLRLGPPLPPSPMGQDWFPHPPNDGGNLGPRYDENGQNRHIFNHKGSGLVADTDRYIHMRNHLNQYNNPYADSTQSEYNSYPNVDGKGYIGSNENYFSTPYRQPVQPSWPLLHQKMASNGDPRQLSENPKDIREELMRKHSPSSSSIPLPNSAHGDYPPPLQSVGGDGHPIGAPIPPDYFYEDGPSGGHHSISSSHRGNNYQKVEPGSPIQTQEQVAQQKAYPAHHETLPAQHPKQKALLAPKEGVEDEDEGEDETTESDVDEGEPIGSLPQDKPQNKKVTTTAKPPTIKQTNTQHQSPVHMSLKHEIPQTNIDGDSEIPDGESSRPKGAILSLTLGMGITAIMVALMAWRLRVIKRRFRRGGGKSPYAHDADYLVNGMYL